MENQIKLMELEEKIDRLEEKLSSSMIYDNSLIKRSLGILGHNILAQLILFIPMVLIFGLFFGMLSSLFSPEGLDQGW